MFWIFIAIIFCGFFFVSRLGGCTFFFPVLHANRSTGRLTRILSLTFVICFLVFVFVLMKLGSADVRSDSDEILFYACMFLVWLLLVLVAFEYLGVSLRDDIAERGNPAATATICGLIVGETFCFAGANSGNGPGSEVVLICAGLTTAALFLAWILFNAFTRAVDEITIERNPAAGLRFAGLLSASGAILGASVAGDWVSLEGTLRDFARYCWPVLVVLAAAVLLEKYFSYFRLRRPVELAVSAFACGLFLCSGVVYAAHVWSRQ